MEKGVSPLVASVLMLAIIISLVGSAAIFITDQQDEVNRNIKQPQLETINLTCTRQTVSWWIANTAKYGVQDRRAEIFFNEEGMPNRTLYRPNEVVPAPLTDGKSRAHLFLTLAPEALKIGQDYHIELVTPNTDVSGTCTAGTQWWDVNWDYRRRVLLSSSTVDTDDRTSVKIDPQQMIQDGKLQPHCQDLRVVIGNSAVPYNLSNAPQNCASTGTLYVTLAVDDVATDKYRAYLYYGNPAADNQSVQISGSTSQSPLGEEEQIGLPQR